MKKIYTTLVLLCAVAFANGQIVSIPDINFKLKLLSANTTTNQIAKDLNGNWTVIDTNNDGLIQQSEANNISYLDLSYISQNNPPYGDLYYNGGPTNFTGISSFIKLNKLIIGTTTVTSNLNLSNLFFLENLEIPSGTFNNVNLNNCSSLINVKLHGFPFGNITSPTIYNMQLLGCTNLEIFDYRYFCTLNSFDGTDLINLTDLFLNIDNNYFSEYYSNLISVNISNCINLKKFKAKSQKLSNINFSGLLNLEEVEISNQQVITSVNFLSCNSLKEILANNNSFLGDFVLDNLPSLEKLFINQLRNESITNPSNNINISISNCINLKEISSLSNQRKIQNFTISNSNNLQKLYLSNNKISNSLNFNNFTNLTNLEIENNLITNLNLNCPSLLILKVQNNQLTTLDLSSCGNLQSVNCDNNNLEYISFKNNTNETKSFLNNPNLTYICADDMEQQSVQYIVNVYEMWDTCVVGDYCSFNPNGNYNTISGNALYDNETDGCDTNDAPFEFLRVNMTDGTNSGSTFTNFEGDYAFFMNNGTFTLTPQLENPTYFNVSPVTTQIAFANNNNNTASQDFCITPNGTHNDLEVVLAQVTPARPGFDAEYRLVYKNKGNQPLSGAVSVTFDDAKSDFVSASVVPTSNIIGSLSWNYSNLLPFENRSIAFTLNVNTPTETPAVNNGDILAFNAQITPLTGDEVPADNVFVYNQTVVGSFDPNDIYCLEGSSLDPSMIGNYLHYNVRFENTGTAAAENIVVATTINPAEYDLSSLQVMNASHNVYTRLNGNLVEFIFENIQLAGSPSGGHGHVLFKMKSNPNVQTTGHVTSNANIFFDYNFPVPTNDATTVFETLQNRDFTKDTTVTIAPNPAEDSVTLSAQSNINAITIFDAQGRIVQFIKADSLQKTIDVNHLKTGMYILEIQTETGKKVEKLMKK